jgi:hypothetical protein
MTQLMILNLFGTKITDEGVQDLKNLKRLAVLDLISTQVTDRAIKGVPTGVAQMHNLGWSRLNCGCCDILTHG